MSSQLPRLAKVKAQYHAGSDTHYVLGWFFRDGVQIDDYPVEPDLSVKVEKSGAYLDDTDTREEIALFLVDQMSARLIDRG
ncbi:hypothetical protein BH789_gp009 [Gordonia phage GMA6]|uniref:Uncharacterized protein n=1 Tax=Gordonia phage GMA6 TaxID=1647285 RepID=A0A0K0NKP7_9CAUD|nr:hypothetical protein BH789_gp009 [Gordonia phage GMA6]AKL88290.1 hypothetical protein GMA6_9 [Gordonia phage GMA6]